MTQNLLYFDKNAVQQVPVQHIYMDTHDILKQPYINLDKYIQDMVNQHNAKYPVELRNTILSIQQQINNLSQEIQSTNTQISDTKSEKEHLTKKLQHIKQEIEQDLEQLKKMFPERRHEYILSNFDEHDKLLNVLHTNMNVLTKVFKSKAQTQQFETLYSNIAQNLKTLGITTPNELSSAIQDKLNQYKSKTNKLQENLDSLLKQSGHKQYALEQLMQQHTKLQNELTQDIAIALHFYNSRHDLRKKIPPIINMQGLTEPVAFFQTIQNITKAELTKLLEHVGLSIGYKPSEYIIRETTTITAAPCLELVTPFYSPEQARTNITTLMRYLAEHGATFSGIINPATYSQINPTPKKETQKTTETKSQISQLIQEKIQSANTTNLDAFIDKYYNPTNRNQYLFRGQTFLTSNPESSYATPTWRTGRTGIAYATTDPRYAATYATDVNQSGIAGKTMNNDNLLKINNHNVGFITVFQNDKHNIMVHDMSLEKIDTNKKLKQLINKNNAHVNETVLSQKNNPIIARFMIIGDKITQIDENDKKWQTIMDYMAPDLSKTHIHGINQLHTNILKQQTHGAQLLQRIQEIESEQERTKKIKTYDISNEILTKMGHIKNITQFEQGAKKLKLAPTKTLTPAQSYIITSNSKE